MLNPLKIQQNSILKNTNIEENEEMKSKLDRLKQFNLKLMKAKG